MGCSIVISAFLMSIFVISYSHAHVIDPLLRSQHVRLNSIAADLVEEKRAALLLDRLMVALQKAVDEQGIGDSRGGKELLRTKPRVGALIGPQPGGSKTGMDLQRRGPANGSVYWRCYFNAVTCFKRK
ncbi:uncharacterized protein LOC135161759 isoform X2 [Diachasmimorpha longicaudata]|uniref:uncharacterized protein LOC135161759 isoform X2 n=1 Tax=Diachasmimorpha longicaudata TaxID=58733 RepID=UPI0030B897CD